MKIFVPICLTVIAGVSGQKFTGTGLDGQPFVVDAETLIKFGLIHGKSDPIPPKLNFYQYPNGKIVKGMDNYEPGALSHVAVPEPQYAVPVPQASFQAVSPQSSFAFPFQLAGGNSAGGIGIAAINQQQQQQASMNPTPMSTVSPVGPITPAAVVSNHKIAHYDTIPSLVSNPNNQEPTTIDVPANVIPVNFIFRSASSVINVEHKHEGATGSFKETLSTDEPHQLHHTVQKPIIQQVREIISPYRKVIQEVEPVREEIDTMVAKGMFKAAQAGQSSTQHAQNLIEQQHHQQQQQHHHQNKALHFAENNEPFTLSSEKHLKKIPSTPNMNKNRVISFKPNSMMQFPSGSSVFNYKSANDMFASARALSASPLALSSSSSSSSSSPSMSSVLHHPFASYSPKSRAFFMSAP